MQRFVTVIRYMLVVPLVLVILFGTMFLDAYVSSELLERCPPEAFTLGGDSVSSFCADTRLRTTSYLVLLLSHVVAVTSIIVSATLLAPAKKASTALYAALITTWLVMGSAVLFSELDAFDLPDYALPVQQLAVGLWAASCVYAVHRRYGADFSLTDDETATVAILAVFLAVPYLMVFFLSS